MPDLTRSGSHDQRRELAGAHGAIDRIVPLDEFDLEMASTLREHMRVPGMGESTVRFFRDKLAMRMQAEERGMLVPEFVPIFNHDRIREFMQRVPPPWLLKPRHSASAIGIKKISARRRAVAGARRARRSSSRIICSSDTCRATSFTSMRSRGMGRSYSPRRTGTSSRRSNVYHGGGLFCTRTLERGSEESRRCSSSTSRIVTALGMTRGALHTEFIRGRDDGRYYFLETAARVGGANIVALVEAATGLNLWREWARVEVASAHGEEYAVPLVARTMAGC